MCPGSLLSFSHIQTHALSHISYKHTLTLHLPASCSLSLSISHSLSCQRTPKHTHPHQDRWQCYTLSLSRCTRALIMKQDSNRGINSYYSCGASCTWAWFSSLSKDIPDVWLYHTGPCQQLTRRKVDYTAKPDWYQNMQWKNNSTSET